MSKKGQYTGLRGKIGGLAVKGMIRNIEQQMANGMQINAGPNNLNDAKLTGTNSAEQTDKPQMT